jgi:hypothetical protein
MVAPLFPSSRLLRDGAALASTSLVVNIRDIREQLRNGTSRSLRRRRWVALLSVLGAVDFAIISLYQLGVIRHLPDPPGRIFDSDRVNASHKAYALGVPDGTLGLGLYALTLIPAGAGGDPQSGRSRWLDLLRAARERRATRVA